MENAHDLLQYINEMDPKDDTRAINEATLKSIKTSTSPNTNNEEWSNEIDIKKAATHCSQRETQDISLNNNMTQMILDISTRKAIEGFETDQYYSDSEQRECEPRKEEFV